VTRLAPPTAVRAYHTPGGSIEALVAAKAGRSIGVCIPARNEAATVGPIVSAITDWLVPAGLVDAVVVVDDGSTDATGWRPDRCTSCAHTPERSSTPSSPVPSPQEPIQKWRGLDRTRQVHEIERQRR